MKLIDIICNCSLIDIMSVKGKLHQKNSRSKDRKKDCPKCDFKSFNRCIRCINCEHIFHKKIGIIKNIDHPIGINTNKNCHIYDFKRNYKCKATITYLNIYKETDTKFICDYMNLLII